VKDFEAIEKAIQATGVSTDYMVGEYDGLGRAYYAEFSISCLVRCSEECPFGCRISYAYNPGGSNLDYVPNELWFDYIKEDWYLRVEDWN
jgi:hypothetical protein